MGEYAKELEERCESVKGNPPPTDWQVVFGAEYERCVLKKGHTGYHLGTKDNAWRVLRPRFIRQTE